MSVAGGSVSDYFQLSLEFTMSWQWGVRCLLSPVCHVFLSPLCHVCFKSFFAKQVIVLLPVASPRSWLCAGVRDIAVKRHKTRAGDAEQAAGAACQTHHSAEGMVSSYMNSMP